MPMRITELNLFPIKGCRGHSVDEMTVDTRGAVGDRRLMLVTPTGMFITQREVPRLATVVPRLDGSRLVVEAPWSEPLRLDIDWAATPRAVVIWKNILTAHDQGDAAARWFSGAAGAECRLVAFGAESHRRIDPRYAPDPLGETTFTDGYPLLVATEASLAALNERLDVPVPMARFRPNVVVSGSSAWDEDHWQVLTLGALTCDVVKPCDRCVVTTVDQASGARDPRQEPLRTLTTFRKVEGQGVLFGQNLVPRGPGVVRRGDVATAS